MALTALLFLVGVGFGCSPADNAIRVDFRLPNGFEGPVHVTKAKEGLDLHRLDGAIQVPIPVSGRLKVGSLPWRILNYQAKAFIGDREVGVGHMFGRCPDCRFWIINQGGRDDFFAFVGSFEEATRFTIENRARIDSTGVLNEYRE